MMPKSSNNIVTISAHAQEASTHPAIVLGIITGINSEGYPLVSRSREQASPIAALTQVAVTASDIDKTCTLAFIDGDPLRPLVLGLLYSPQPENDTHQTGEQGDSQEVLDIDSEEAVVIRSDQSIILQTGKSRMELYPDGHIYLQGVSIHSQAYGPNRVKGGSVKLN